MLTEGQVVEVHHRVAEVRTWLLDIHQELERFAVDDAPILDESLIKRLVLQSLEMAGKLSDLERRLWWHSHTPEELE